jgi:BON domain
MNVDDTSLDDMVDDDYAQERDMDAAELDLLDGPPIDMPAKHSGQNNARMSETNDPDDTDDEDEEEGEASAPRPRSDAEITARVRRLLRSDSATSMLRIQVMTEDGVVTLRGLVQTLDDTDNAAEVASRVEGVVDVIDELEVEP